jgi:hypothetical protein
MLKILYKTRINLHQEIRFCSGGLYFQNPFSLQHQSDFSAMKQEASYSM